ncbi:olfactory receptor 6C76-like [Hyla sarda]|uniref:olfactory receptor 6C76-like n=1 Tax=Hyla sarda TaxID=327740 RepID=UPI0024C2A0CE|nr:olfactory receptor 6C76-like [Hyla sarda]
MKAFVNIMISYNLTHFVLAGFTLNPALKICVVTSLIPIYILSLMGNLLTIITISIDQNLQAPMYLFLRILATLDILFISSTVPKLVSILMSSDDAISINGCLLQLYFYVSAGGTEFYILGLLSIDRYIAICHPLRYTLVMSSQVCWRLIISFLTFGFLEFIPAIHSMSRLQWCSGNNVIDHFFCDGSALLHLSCSDTYNIEIMFFYFACFAILSSLIPTISSYCFIISTILRIPSSSGRKKTFSTCSSHFIAVLFAYGSCIVIYVTPSGAAPFSIGKSVAIFNSILCPFLHPFIYSLRNKAVMTSLRHMIGIEISIK